MPAAKKAGLKHIVTFYGVDVCRLPKTEPVWIQRYKELFRHVHLVLCEGPFMAKSIIDLGCPHNKVKVHHLGVAVNRILFKHRTWKKGQTLRVLIAATFREKKGIPYAIEGGIREVEITGGITVPELSWRAAVREVEPGDLVGTGHKFQVAG